MFITYAFERPSACSDISGSLLCEKLVSGFYCLLNLKRKRKKKKKKKKKLH